VLEKMDIDIDGETVGRIRLMLGVLSGDLEALGSAETISRNSRFQPLQHS